MTNLDEDLVGTNLDHALGVAKIRATPEEKRSRMLTGVYFALSAFVRPMAPSCSSRERRAQ